MAVPARTIEDVYNLLVAVRTDVTQLRTDVDTLRSSVRRLEFGADLKTLRHSVHHLSERVQALELNRDEENRPPADGHNGKNNSNIASSWPIIVNENALNEASILPHLLHEANEQAQQQVIETMEENDEICDEDQLQNMIENYSKHVIKQTQNQQMEQTNKNSSKTAERSTSHLQKKITAQQQQTPMSHSHPCLFLDGTKSNEDSGKRPDNLPQQASKTTKEIPFKNNLYKSESDRTEKISTNQQLENENKFLNGIQQQKDDQNSTNLIQQKQQIEKLQRKCNRLEQLESSYRKIEKDYEQMLCQQERREELSKIAIQKLEHQLRVLDAENEQLRSQNANIGAIFGVQQKTGEVNNDQQIHFLLNELIPKNNELLVIQERQRLELDAQSATLEEQRTHIEVLEKALANAQERLAAKERAAIDAAAVVDKCSHLQRILQEALEDKQRQKEQHGRQVAQLEMELTQLRLQLAKENNSQAIGSLGRKGGAITAAAGCANNNTPEATDEMLKLKKELNQKEERISQLETSLLQIQRRFGGGIEQQQQQKNFKNCGGGTEIEAMTIRWEIEKAEKERRIQELLDDKMRIQMQWAEERRSLDVRVRMLEKDLRHFMGSQSSLASSGGAGSGIGGYYPTELNEHNSPFSSIRGSKFFHRSTAELPTSARGATLYDERIASQDVMARMEELGRKLAEKCNRIIERPPTLNIQKSSNLQINRVPADLPSPQRQQIRSQSRSSSSEQPLAHADISPGSEEQPSNGGTPLYRQSASSTSSSSKKRYLVNASASQLNAYLEQLPEATRRRLAGDRVSSGGFHLMAGIERNGGVSNRREGGCRRLLRDHSVETRKGNVVPELVAPPPPPNYQEAAQQRRETQPPPPYQGHQQLRQMHQMASIEEPGQEPPPIPPMPAYIQQQQQQRTVKRLML
uniref:Uncharacterized protein n=1 Tax=Meloidogyne enterolobii TaxID=390850 RepID=A0A6V7V3B5_MELEN|nr:unnamed protein product [Meloidogyne enterolobii]